VVSPSLASFFDVLIKDGFTDKFERQVGFLITEVAFLQHPKSDSSQPPFFSEVI
jgi:hypothetical protein